MGSLGFAAPLSSIFEDIGAKEVIIIIIIIIINKSLYQCLRILEVNLVLKISISFQIELTLIY